MPRIPAPSTGDPITADSNGNLSVPDHPIVPFVRGDGTGPDIWKAAQRVLDAAVHKAYGKHRQIAWYELFAGDASFQRFKTWLPDETIEAFRTFRVGIKGPLTTPVGKGIRSLNVSLRQVLDLYVCLRPVRWFRGAPSPVLHPEKVDMVIFRENTEDIYAGIEWPAQSPEARRLINFLIGEMGVNRIRFPATSGIGIKTISREGTERLVQAAINYALRERRKSVSFTHKGNIMKFTEGAFRDWAYQVATSQYRDRVVTARESWVLDYRDKHPEASLEEHARALEPGYDQAPAERQTEIRDEVQSALLLVPSLGNGRWTDKLLVKDSIADITLQQVLTRPEEFDVIATTNLNGDYLSDALAAQVGGIGIAPGGNINYTTGHAIFEATHGTAPKYAGLDVVNPGSVILSGEMMLRHLGWREAAALVIKGMDGAIQAKTVTYDFARLLPEATKVKCSEFGTEVIRHMDDNANS